MIQIVTMMQFVCPPNLLRGLFTAGAINNIDYNTSSTTATGSFHGTGISLFQHPNEHSGGVDRREHRILTRERTCDTNLPFSLHWITDQG